MDVEDHRRRAYHIQPKVEASKKVEARAQNRDIIHAEKVIFIVHGTIRYYFKSEVGHHHGVRHAEDVVGVGRAVEGEDADLRFASVEARELSVGRDAISTRSL